jgi:hypothetical protein
MARRTTLGLAAVPRSAPFLAHEEQVGSARPGTKRFTRLSLLATPRRPQTFTAKEGPPQANARIELTIAPQATLLYMPRRYTATDIVLSIRPMTAVLTFAHRTTVPGAATVGIQVTAQLRYHREGSANSLQGNNEVSVVPFGNIRHRAWSLFSGHVTVDAVPDAGLVYSASGVRNYHIGGSTRSITSVQATVQYTEIGLSFSVAGSSSFGLAPSGRVSIVRETTYGMHGSVSLSLVSQGSVDHEIGPPVAYHISASADVALVPRATLALVTGLVNQYAVLGDVTFGTTPGSRVTVRRAPVLDVLAQGRRRFIRIFR